MAEETKKGIQQGSIVIKLNDGDDKRLEEAATNLKRDKRALAALLVGTALDNVDAWKPAMEKKALEERQKELQREIEETQERLKALAK